MENWYSKLYDKKDVTDPFVDVKLGKARIAKTAVIDNSLNPVLHYTPGRGIYLHEGFSLKCSNT